MISGASGKIGWRRVAEQTLASGAYVSQNYVQLFLENFIFESFLSLFCEHVSVLQVSA